MIETAVDSRRRHWLRLAAGAAVAGVAPGVAAAPDVANQANSGARFDAWRGGPLPALKLTGLNGQPADLSSYKGRLLVLNFWATWCVPCRAEMPSLERLHRSFAGKPATVIGISVGDVRMSVQRFTEEYQLTFPILLDEDKSQFKRWKVGILPTTFLIDELGVPRYRQVGERTWDDPETIATIGSMFRGKV